MKRTHQFQSLMLASALLVSFSLPTAALAHDHDKNTDKTGTHQCKHDGEHKGMKGMHKGCSMMQELGLTDDQKARMKEAHQTFRTQNAAAIASMKAKYKQLKELGDDPANQAQREQLRAQLKQEKAALRNQHKASMKGILTAEQESKMETLKQQCKAKHQGAKKSDKKAPATPIAN